MMKIRPSIFLLILALMSLSAGNAMAESFKEKPVYTAHTYSRAELINLGTYDSPPIQFQWPVADVRQMPVGERLDFVITLNANSAEVIGFFEKAFDSKTVAATLVPHVLPFQSSRELRVIGRSVDATPSRFTLSGDGSRRFTIDISPDGARTKLVLQNIMIGQLYSGVVPARAPFTPRSAEPVSFLWN